MNIKDIIRNFSDERWAIGIVEMVPDGSPMDVHWVRDKQRNRWFADPFILSASEQEIVVLCEEMYKPRGIKKGRISKVVVDRSTWTVTDVKCLLQLDTHLSFPAYYRKGGEVYVYPENSESGSLTLYRYNQAEEKLEAIQKICDEPVTDAIITDAFGERMLFCTKQPDPNGNVLYMYRWNEGKGRFENLDCHSYAEKVARMAGNFFTCNGKIYRPTQECNVQYGHAVTLQEVAKVSGSFRFQEVRRIYSSHPYLQTGCHTFNVYPEGNLIVMDALGFDRMWFRKLLKFLRIMK